MANNTDKNKLPKKRPDFNLVMGTLLVLLIAILAILGPRFAPKDPLEQFTIIHIDDQWHTPPLDVGINGYLLGTDSFGRDTLSRLMYAIRPTLQMVVAVALLRLFLGTVIGIIAGWSTRWIGRLFETFISSALAVPVLIVALGGIAAVGVELGVIAFIVALSITGWVETARIVRDQTETIRNQQYIEAAQAMGAPTISIIFRHILRQLRSLIWILLAFEISSTLMLTAALGFLGYYIGGDIWTPGAQDGVAQAISGMPELGQMLATTEVSVTHPWGMIAVGSIVFITVLGFNMFGAGLRERYTVYDGTRRSAVGDTAAAISLWFDQYIFWPIGNLLRNPLFRTATRFAGAVLLIGAAGWYAWENRPRPPLEPVLPQVETQIWGMNRHDIYSTYWTSQTGPKTPDVAWIHEDPNGLAGGPAIGSNGIIYIANTSGQLIGLDMNGEVKLLVNLPQPAAAAPSISTDGVLYIVDRSGGLTALNLEGEIIWHMETEESTPATASATVGPFGLIYYPTGGVIHAVSPSGEQVWQKQAFSAGSTSEPLFFSPDGELLFTKHVILDPQTGEILDNSARENSEGYFIGADGRLFKRSGQNLIPWQINTDGEIENSVTWKDAANFTLSVPKDAGNLPNGSFWLFYDTFAPGFGQGTDTRVVWIEPDGKTVQNINYPTRGSKVIGVDQKGVVFACGNRDRGYGAGECQAFSPEREEPIWTYRLENSKAINGGALMNGRLFVSTEEGELIALGQTPTTSDPSFIGIIEEAVTLEGGGNDVQAKDTRIGPKDQSVQLVYVDEKGYASAPVAGPNNTIYIASKDPVIYQFDLSGNLIAQIELDTPVFGGLNSNDDGRLFAVLKDGSLAVYEENQLVWRFNPNDSAMRGQSIPTFGPSGEIYYTTTRGNEFWMQAVSAEGEPLWRAAIDSFNLAYVPTINSTGEYVFYKDLIFSASDGSELPYELTIDVEYFFTGENQRDYMVVETSVIPIVISPEEIYFTDERIIAENLRPSLAGVTQDGYVWMHFRGGSALFDSAGNALGQIGINNSIIPTIVGREDDMTFYSCGRSPSDFRSAQTSICAAYNLLNDEILWRVELGERGGSEEKEVTGGVLMPGRIFAVNGAGELYAIGSVTVVEESTADEAGLEPNANSPITGELTLGDINSNPVEPIFSVLIADENGFSGGMVVGENGLIVFPSNGGQLYLYDLYTNSYRVITLDTTPVGAPSLSDDGYLYTTDNKGGVYKLTQEGEVLWYFQPDNAVRARNSVVLGPQGQAFYALQASSGGVLQAVNADGQNLWQAPLQTGSFFREPGVSPDGLFVFLKDEVFTIQDGIPLNFDINFEIRHFFTGEDRQTYLLSDNSILPVVFTMDELIILEGGAFLDTADTGFAAGVGTGGVSEFGYIWFQVTDGQNGVTRLSLFNPDGSAVGTVRLQVPGGGFLGRYVMGIDRDLHFVTCGFQIAGQAMCVNADPVSGETLWIARLRNPITNIFGFESTASELINGYLYLAMDDGRFIVIGKEDIPPAILLEANP